MGWAKQGKKGSVGRGMGRDERGWNGRILQGSRRSSIVTLLKR